MVNTINISALQFDLKVVWGNTKRKVVILRWHTVNREYLKYSVCALVPAGDEH